MRFHLEGWERNGIGKFVVVRLEDGIVVGRVGVQLLDPVTWEPAAGGAGQAELGWSLRAAHWGHGYATEAAAAVRDWYPTPDRLVSLIQPHSQIAGRGAPSGGRAGRDDRPRRRSSRRVGAPIGENRRAMIETDRLLLRKPKLGDAKALQIAYGDPEVMEFVGTGDTRTLDET